MLFVLTANRSLFLYMFKLILALANFLTSLYSDNHRREPLLDA
jgi:hypothetical protein